MSAVATSFDPTASIIKPAFDNMPAELKDFPQWVVWRYQAADKPGGKLRKPPYDPKTGRAARTDDPTTWGTFAEAEAAYRGGGYAGVGVVLTPGLGLVAHDADGVVDPATGRITSPAAQKFVAAMDSYTEISPSGTGIRLFSWGTLPAGAWRNRRDAFGDGRGLEQYSGGQFVTVTGRRSRNRPAGLENRQAEIDACHFRFAPASAATPVAIDRDAAHLAVIAAIEAELAENPDSALDAKDRGLLDRAFAAANGQKFKRLWGGDTSAFASASEADAAFCLLAAFWTGKNPARIERWYRNTPLLANPARSKAWDDVRRIGTYGSLTIATAIERCREVYAPGSAEAQDDVPAGWLPSTEFESRHLAAIRDPGQGFFSRTAAGIVPGDLKKRDWVIAGKLISSYLHIIQAPGGLGKSTLANLLALAVAASRHDLLGAVHSGGAAFIYNAEDPRDEMERRLYGAAAHHCIDLAAACLIFYESGHDHALCLVAAGKNGDVTVNEAAFLELVENFKSNNVKLAIFDPLVRLHRCQENSNEQMDVVARVFTMLARLTGAAVVVVHHTNKAAASKSGNAEGMDAGRGASAVVDAARVVFNLLGMDKAEAKKAGIGEQDRRNFMRLHNSKNNLAPATSAEWLRKASFELPSGESVPVAEPARLAFVEEVRPEDDPATIDAVADRIVDVVTGLQATGGPALTAKSLKEKYQPLWGREILGVSSKVVDLALAQTLAQGILQTVKRRGRNNRDYEYLQAVNNRQSILQTASLST